MTDSKNELRKHPIIILGVDRSGTSLVANLVHLWGAYGGDLAQLSKGDEGNRHGYWENQLLADFMEHFGIDIGIDFWHPSYVDVITTKAADPYYRNKALSLISMMERKERVWFWKEPWLSVMLPFWKQIWSGATYVITVRNPYDSALSWQKFFLPEEAQLKISIVAATLLRWQAMLMSALENTQDCTRKIFIRYEDLVNEPQKQCRRLFNFLSDEYRLKRIDDGQLESILGTVDSKSWRNRSSTPFNDVSIATESQKALYQFLLEKIDDPDKPFDATQYPIYPGWREYMGNLEILRDLYIQLKKISDRG